MRYHHITSDFCDANMLETEDVCEGSAGRIVPPLLPSLLAACAPSAELKLHIASDQGESAWEFQLPTSTYTAQQ